MKYVNTASYPIDIDGGRMVPPGGLIETNPDSEHDKALILRGVLAEVPEEGPVLVDDTTDEEPPKGKKGGKA